MKTKNIVVKNADDIQKLVDEAGRVNGDIFIETEEGNAKYDASSLLGLFSVKHGSKMAISYHDTADDVDDFVRTLELMAQASGF